MQTSSNIKGASCWKQKGNMKDSNIIAGNATIKQQQKEVLLNTKGQYMKESNTLVNSVEKN